MLRDNLTILDKMVPAQYKAAAAMKTGMGVVINGANFQFPAAETSANLYFVNKERLAGQDNNRTNFSDYAERYIAIAAGEFAKLQKYLPGEEFLTDQKGAATIGKRVAVGTNGLLKDATAASPYLYVEDVNDNGHILMKIRVLDTAAAN